MSNPEPTFEEWQNSLLTAEKAMVSRLVRRLFGSYDLKGVINVHQQLQLCIVDWLQHLNLLSEAQQQDVVQALGPELLGFSKQLATSHGCPVRPKFTLAICEMRWVSCTGQTKFFDTREFRFVDRLPELAVTHIICDVTALYLKMLRRWSRLKNTTRPNKDVDHGCELPQPGPEDGGGSHKAVLQWPAGP